MTENKMNEILNDTEKEYLSSKIKQFRDRVLYIYKAEVLGYECLTIEFLKFPTVESYRYIIVLPGFEKGTAYKGMEIDKRYNLDELGL